MRKVVALAGLFLCIGIAAQATPIFENGFNFPGSAPNYQTVHSGGTVAGVWSVGGTGVDWVGSYWDAEEGNGSVDLSGGTGAGWLSVVLDTTPGHDYLVTFWLSANPDSAPPSDKIGDPKQVLVSFGDASQQFDYAGGNKYRDMQWVQESYVFRATGTTETLKFTSLDNMAWGPAIDNVSVTWVPEPASMLLAGLGLLGVGGLIRLRRRNNK
jgi:choice-of-anchor C domain-containing protein